MKQSLFLPDVPRSRAKNVDRALKYLAENPLQLKSGLPTNPTEYREFERLNRKSRAFISAYHRHALTNYDEVARYVARRYHVFFRMLPPDTKDGLNWQANQLAKEYFRRIGLK